MMSSACDWFLQTHHVIIAGFLQTLRHDIILWFRQTPHDISPSCDFDRLRPSSCDLDPCWKQHSMVPKRRCWKAEQTFQIVFTTHFSHTRVLYYLGDWPLKSDLKTRSETFVRPSNIFVWELYIPTQAGLGWPIDEQNALDSMHETSSSPYPIRPG